ncbi:MAG: hypothetical protein IKS35_07325 [Clostridia bacterium]|nr:hypothetical protein [Clostridia bacterium]
MRSRVISLVTLLLAAVMLLGILASCGGAVSPDPGKEKATSAAGDRETGKETDTRQTVDTETDPVPESGLPQSYNWKNSEIKFLCWNRPDWNLVRTPHDIVAHEEIGELVNDAVYQRNMEISERYSVNISMELQHQNDVPRTLENQVASGGHEYDVVYPRLYEAAKLITGGNFLNLYDTPYIDLSRSCWDQNCVEELTICDALYFCASDMNVNDKDATAALAFNKKEREARNLANFYELVENGDWTIDALIENAEIAYDDLDSDGRMGESDFFGFVGGNDVMISFFLGSGARIVTKTDPETYDLVIGQDDRDVDVVANIMQVMDNTKTWFYNHHTAGTNDVQYCKLFTDGHGLFFWMRLDEVTNMRASETEFGILPTPKFEEFQDNYYSLVSPHICGILSLPATLDGEALERVSMVVEAMSEQSTDNLQVAYVQQSLMSKYSRDEESASSIRKVLANRVFDPGFLYDFGPLRDQITTLGQTKIALTTLLATYEDSTRIKIEEFLEAVQELQG